MDRHGIEHQPPYSTKVKGKVELSLYSPLQAFMACSRENFTFTLTHHKITVDT
jgi:hypothetical protein